MDNQRAKQWQPLLAPDERATFDFFRQNIGICLKFLRRQGCENNQEQQDIAWEAFQRMLTNIKNGKCKFDSSPKTYWFGIVRKCWLETLKKRRPPKPRSRDWIIEALEEWSYYIFSKTDDEEPEESDPWTAKAKKALNEVYAKLSESCKQDLSMRYGSPPKSYKTIAEERNTTLETVRANLRRCREHLKERASKLLGE